MSEETKENPRTPKRSKRKPALEPLGWDEIVSQPGMGGYLSFLNGPVPLPHLHRAAPEAASGPGAVSGSEPESIAAITPTPEPDSLSAVGPDLGAITETVPETNMAPATITTIGLIPTPEVVSHLAVDVVETTPGLHAAPTAGPTTGSASTPGVLSVPAVVSPPVDTELNRDPGAVSVPPTESYTAAFPMAGVGTTQTGRIRIRKCFSAQDGHSLGEEVLYQALWKAAQPESADARSITIGWRGMSQLCRMTPKNCKINTQRLLRKLALEILSPYNTPESIGTTYRIYSVERIFERRHAAGFEWVVRSRGVEFVDPATGMPVAHVCGYVSN
jgi:hypothetical protein